MADAFIDFGVRMESQSAEALATSAARATCAALHAFPDFSLVELRSTVDGPTASDVLVVDCTCDAVPTKNTVGIRFRERLALRFFRNSGAAPEVRALRSDFPLTMHQSLVSPGEPKALCLYAEPWSAVERAWTPHKHLRRILWWLARASEGALHQDDQPLEPLYLESPYEVILPANLEIKLKAGAQSLSVKRLSEDDEDRRTIFIGELRPAAPSPQKDGCAMACIALELPEVLHGFVEPLPTKLGDLHDQLALRGVDLVGVLREQVGRLAEGKGLLAKGAEQLTLLVVSIPMVRVEGGPRERTLYRGFVLASDLTGLGVQLGILFSLDGAKFYRERLGTGPRSSVWRELSLLPMKVTPGFNKTLARQSSGTLPEGTDAAFALAGVGALGSMLLNLWHRSGWGRWALIDPDRIRPHNLARHTAFSDYAGWPKVEAGRDLESHLFAEEEVQTRAVFASANDFSKPAVAEVLDGAALVVDATTTLEVPRDLASRASVKRACSVFLTPSGAGCVLLLEDATRQVRLDSLEAQYYRAIISQGWGNEHLQGHLGRLWVGAGCRDVSAVIPNSRISLSASILAQQLMQQVRRPAAAIQVWHLDVESGTVATHRVQPEATLQVELGNWRLLWDEGVYRNVRALRAANLPRETGGILLGYFDNKLRTINVVEALPAPPDSSGDISGFTRGVAGLREQLFEARRRTAHIVTYIGEWHSHPPGASARPSSDDERLLDHLAEELARDGFPALMLIVGDAEERWICRRGDTKT